MSRTPLLPLHICTLLVIFCSSISCFSNKCTFVNRCGNFSFSYPFGQKHSSCGDRYFQIYCDPGVHRPFINISGIEFQILEPYILGNNRTHQRIRLAINNFCGGGGKLFGNCTHSWWYRPKLFQMDQGYTDLAFWTDCHQIKPFEKNHTLKSVELCGESWYYSLNGETEINRTFLCKTNLHIPVKKEVMQFNQSISNQTLINQGFWITWRVDPYRDQNCGACLSSKGFCGLNGSTEFLCYCPDGTSQPVKCDGQGHVRRSAIITVAGCFIGGALLAATAIAAVLFTYRARARKRRKSHPYTISKVEKFLEEYAYEMPTRFSFDELKRMTNNFVEKLGEGGFGVVYKGKLLNSTLVAVKLLDRNRHSESQFMNEVATIGRIHHVNLVRLLGYCFENLTSALVYEYMANGSLEKFIFEGKKEEQVLRFKQLYLIALGAARGIAYLHEDCQQRMIHFDIKPHNILLDADFTPKVSDFGLAKLCGKGNDHISMTVARGTPGYAAPEVFNRDLGLLTDKSDVYSFGMLLLEIVGGRKNFDGNLSHSSQFYFPQWAFKMLDRGELELGTRLREGKMETEDAEKARSLIKVGLWCIQYNYIDRPCMSKVVQMIEGNGDDVANPPSSAPEIPSLSLFSSIEESCSIPSLSLLSSIEESCSVRL